MNNKISLKDWLFYQHPEEDYRTVFQGMHRECHRLQESFDSAPLYLDRRNANNLGGVLDRVSLTWTNISDVSFVDAVYIPLEQREDVKKANIDFLVDLAIGIHMNYGYQNGLLNRDVIEKQFYQCMQFLPAEDVPYYEDVVINHKYMYYDEWAREKGGAASVNGTSSTRGFQYVKGGTGKSIDNNEAFVQNAFLSISFFAVAIFVMVMVFIILR